MYGYHRAIRLAERAAIDCPGLHLRIAAVLRGRADADGELENLRAAARTSPASAAAWAWLGSGFIARNQWPEAAAALKRAVAAEPECGPYWARLADALDRCGLAEDAAAAGVTALDCEPENKALRRGSAGAGARTEPARGGPAADRESCAPLRIGTASTCRADPDRCLRRRLSQRLDLGFQRRSASGRDGKTRLPNRVVLYRSPRGGPLGGHPFIGFICH